MSDDDGMMLLNLDTSSSGDVAPSKSKVSGGRWKDRRKAKMMLDGKRSDPRSGSNATLKGTKRPTPAGVETEDVKAEPARKQAKKIQLKPTPADQQIVSSLFTSNRDVATSVNNNVHDVNSGVGPSNAPLLKDSFEASFGYY